MVGTGLRILVVGAGIGGLAVARALRLAGHRPDIVERFTDPAVPGSGIYLPGNATRALRRLRLHEPILPFGTMIAKQRFTDAAGQVLFEVDVTRMWKSAGECRALSRPDLHRVLLSGAGGAVRYGIDVHRIEIGGTSAKVEFTDGASAEYDLVVGADGHSSRVRALAGIGPGAQLAGRVSYRCVVSGPPPAGGRTAWLGDRASVVVTPIGAARLHVDVSEAVAAGGPAPADPVTRLREILAGFGDRLPPALHTVDPVWTVPTGEVLADQWARGPVVLLGDAAHAIPPVLAQGPAMALEDAVVLADELARAGANAAGSAGAVAGVPAALAAYQARRAPRVRVVREQTERWWRRLRAPAVVRDDYLRRHGQREFREAHAPLLAPM